MSKFRKKPVIIDAVQWLPGLTNKEVYELAKDSDRHLSTDSSGLVLCIQTLEGEMQANPGDWIIKGVKGELYPCKPDIFIATYGPIEEHSNH